MGTGGSLKHVFSFLPDVLSLAVVNDLRGHQTNAGVVMLGVVPGEKGAAKPSGVFSTTEPLGELRPVLQGLELGLRIGIVVRDMRATVGLDHSQIQEQLSHRFRFHRTSPIGMDGQLSRHNPLPLATLFDEPLGEHRRLPMGNHPAHHVAAEDIQNHVEGEVYPLGRPLQLGDVPRPELIGSGGEKLRLAVDRMCELISSLPHFPSLPKKPIHGAHGTQIRAFIQERRIDLPRGQIHKTLTVHDPHHLLSFLRPEGPGMLRPAGAYKSQRRFRRSAIEARPGHSQRPAGRQHANSLGKSSGGLRQLVSSPAPGELVPRSADTFFWTSIMVSACSRRFLNRSLSRSSSRMRVSRASTGLPFLPRFLGARPANAPRSNCRRQVVIFDVYRPSPRSRAPSWPDSLALSASRRILTLCSALNFRRLGLSGTSGSAALASRLSPRGVFFTKADDEPNSFNLTTSFMGFSFPAPDTNLPWGRCLTHIDTEGSRRRLKTSRRLLSSILKPIPASLAGQQENTRSMRWLY